jgi:XTP/dITP diphosphohydrolase
MNKLVLATNNEYKIREITEIIDKFPLSILSKKDFKDFPDVEETGETLEDNAILKAKAIFEFTQLPSMADDSGLEVDALGGIPGVNSARYAGPGCTFLDNNEKLLKALKDVPYNKRQATFRCVIAICFAPDDVEIVEGRVEGSITSEIMGKQGFGYDPVFYVISHKKTFAEISADEKNKISHRGQAVEKARNVLIRRFKLEESSL